jgi:hypothetical protein
MILNEELHNFFSLPSRVGRWHNIVGIVTDMAKRFFSFENVHTVSRSFPAFCSLGTGDSCCVGKVARVRSLLHISF